MLRLTTLGAVGIADPEIGSGPHPLTSQPKRLTLLAYLAVAHPGSLAFRDEVLPLLWPEMDEARARRALRQTLYHLRRALGEDVIVTGGNSGIGVDPERLWCDAVALERAVVEDRLEDAVRLYTGEFMPGFHPGGGRNSEQWLDDTRGRLRRRAVAAAAALVEQAEAKGDYGRAVDHARWLVQVVPSDERAARTLIRLLARSGDRAGAVAVYRGLTAHLDRQLDLAPDPDTRALVEAVRTGAFEPAGGAEGVDDGSGSPGDGPAAEHTLAVLPFAGLSGGPEERQFAEGLTEMLITELARESTVNVVSRTSVQRYRTGEESLAAIAEELGVDRVVEGTVLEAGDRLRSTVQLLNTPPERHIWADSFERDVGDRLAAQAELARAMARGVARALDQSTARASGRVSASARDAYFLGRCQFVRMTPAGFVEAARQFQEAIKLDPGYARAHGSLAFTQVTLARSGQVPPREGYRRARRRADRALALDPELAEAHVVRGICAMLMDWDWEEAERHMTRGLRLSTDLPESHWAYSNFLMVVARHQEARRTARRARELDPVAPTLWMNEVLILVGTGSIQEAETVATGLASFHRNHSASAFALGLVQESSGDHDQAADSFARAVELGAGPHSAAARGANLARAGHPAAARRILTELLESRERYIPPTGIARIHAALDQADEAFHWLERAAAGRDDWLPYMDAWPRFEGIREDPRFAELRDRIGLPG